MSGFEGRPARRNATNKMWQEMMNSFINSQELIEKQRVDNFAINQSKETLEQCNWNISKKKFVIKQQ